MVANYQAKSGLLKQSGGEGFWRHSLVNYPVHYFMRFHDKVINLCRQIIEWPMSLKMQILRAVNDKMPGVYMGSHSIFADDTNTFRETLSSL